MKIARGVIIGILLSAGLVVTVYAADMNTVGPQASAAQIITAHGGGQSPILRLIFDTSSGSEKGTMTVEIASDFILVEDANANESLGGRSLYDFKLKRGMTIDDARHVFTNDSTYAMVDFHYAESYNRHMLRSVLSKAGAKGPEQIRNAFWDQQDLSVALPGDDTPAVTQAATSGGGMNYVVDNIVAAHFEPSKETLSPDELRGFARFLWMRGHLHPMVVKAIVASGVLPAQLEARNVMGDKQTLTVWKLVSVERTTRGYPLPADYSSNLTSSQEQLGEPLRGLLPTMLDAVSGKFGNGPRSQESYRSALADASAKGDMLQYYVLDSELSLQYGVGVNACLNHWPSATDCSNAEDIARKLVADQRAFALLKTFALESHGDVKNALAQRVAISRDGLSDAYMFDDWIGNAMTESGDADGALAHIPIAIRGNPYVGSFYKDLGDVFEHAFMPRETWICYDLARALPGGPNAPIVDAIGEKEHFLETKFPEFF
jgi:hypothetical protein